MGIRTKIAAIAFLAMTLTSCGEPAPNENDQQYKLGFQAGEEAGLEEGKNAKCDEIGQFSDSMLERLKEENICS